MGARYIASFDLPTKGFVTMGWRVPQGGGDVILGRNSTFAQFTFVF
jgi:hypothetical protein